VHGLEKEYGDRITFVRVNILDSDNESMLEQFNFSTTPEFYLLDGQGQTIGFWGEEADEDGLRQAFDTALEQSKTQ
jgi:hypothetical protein